MKLFTHLNFGGNCEAAFRFYETQLGGKVTMMMRVSDLPAGVKPPAESSNAVIHARMDIAGVEVIGNDVPPQHFKPVRSSYLYLSVDSGKEADRIFGILAKDGEVGMPIAETFFASRFGQLRDKFGVLWTILHELPR
jgi:PhnB protein